METVQQAKKNFSALRAERREIEYPAKCKSVNAKDKHKEKTLCGNPEVLFTDYAQQKEGRKKNNLIFFTDSIYIWKDTLCSNYLAKVKEDAEYRENSFTRQVQHLTEKLSSVLTMTTPSTTTPWHLLTQPAANSQLCPSQLPSTQPEEQDPQVVLLADSNGKFLDTRKLFPDKKVLSKHCSTTGQAMKLLKKETLRSPQYLVIHTGTNYLHTLRRDTAEADHHPCCEETQQLSPDLPLPTQPEEATFTQLTPFTTSAAEICSNSCSLSPSPPTAAELCCSCSPTCCHPPSLCYL
ncbi:hypothetical protein F7725_023485 [Dissostichus mawsoni]|uniref:Uncharacterized protein n=1 Tax=Dissostichus mawsoni TaxID=36200 RepID=A0A7J5Z182_DISMA|nr:hypothetical protein F7725_023485 [Dissostichus mawsoni]